MLPITFVPCRTPFDRVAPIRIILSDMRSDVHRSQVFNELDRVIAFVGTTMPVKPRPNSFVFPHPARLLAF